MADTASPREGRTVDGKYKLVRQLAQGGMGAVYSAVNTWTAGEVAIKLLPSERAGDDQLVARFKQEARSASRLLHPNIVRVYDLGVDEDGSLYMVQELLQGQDLKSRLQATAGKLAFLDAMEVALPIMEGLVYAHEQGILHRDLKPGNIFLTETPTGMVPKLIDFGISKVIAPDMPSSVLTMTGTVVGTPLYMAPEQVLDETLDARADVWGMGVVLYEMLAGRHPFDGGGNYNRTVVAVLNQPIAPLEGAVTGMPAAVWWAIERALSRKLDQRWPSMRALLDELLTLTAPLSAKDTVRFDDDPELVAQMAGVAQSRAIEQGGGSSCPPLARQSRASLPPVEVVELPKPSPPQSEAVSPFDRTVAAVTPQGAPAAVASALPRPSTPTTALSTPTGSPTSSTSGIVPTPSPATEKRGRSLLAPLLVVALLGAGAATWLWRTQSAPPRVPDSTVPTENAPAATKTPTSPGALPTPIDAPGETAGGEARTALPGEGGAATASPLLEREAPNSPAVATEEPAAIPAPAAAAAAAAPAAPLEAPPPSAAKSPTPQAAPAARPRTRPRTPAAKVPPRAVERGRGGVPIIE